MATPYLHEMELLRSIGEIQPNAINTEIAPFSVYPYDRNDSTQDIAQDDADMKRLGIHQELQRKFQLISTIGFTSCVMGTWEILFTANATGLMNGGLAGLFWSLIWIYFGQFFVVLSLAEMSSMVPTAGGQYHWVSELSPIRCQKFLSYCSGWLTAISWQAIVVVDCYLVALTVQAMIKAGDVTYQPTRWHATLLTIATAVAVSSFNIFLASHLSLCEGVFAICHFFAFVPVVVSIWLLAPEKAGLEVLLRFEDNGGGWPNTAISLLVGQVSNMFVVLGSDGVAHLAEEIGNAGVVLPKSMVWSYILNFPFALILVLTLCFNLASPKEAVASTVPFVYLFSEAFPSTGMTLAFSAIMLGLLVMITISALASTSRQTFAFARDNGLPYSVWLSKVDDRLKVPVNAIITSAIFTILMALVNIASTVAFSAMISLSNATLMGTYMISIGCMTLRRLKKQRLPPARWSLGRAGLPINLMAMLYSFWAFFWSFWPSQYEVNFKNFNWSAVMFVVFVGFALALYLVRARRTYERPKAIVQDVESET